MKYKIALLVVPIFLLIVLIPVLAQSSTVTEDDVARVAEQMYCPVCENIPLDDCGTSTCIQWKDEIRDQLVAGSSDQEIINDFIDRYGQHVVGIPQDPLLRSISLITPWLGVAVVLVLGGMTFLRWRNNPLKGAERVIAVPEMETPIASDDDYRARFEQDLS